MKGYTIFTFFPATGWQYEVVVENDNTLALNIHNCFYLKFLQYSNAPELTPVFCRMEDFLMGATPVSIHWDRTQTIGMDLDYCNFRWDYVPEKKAGKG